MVISGIMARLGSRPRQTRPWSRLQFNPHDPKPCWQSKETDTKDEKLRVVAWGTYDLGKPRDRILLRGLRENDVEVLECHSDVWQGIEDKEPGRRLASKDAIHDS